MIYLQFRKGSKEDKPVFKNKDISKNKVSGELKGIYYNPSKEVTTKEGKIVTIPANVNVILDETSVTFSVENGMLFRSTMNSLLSASIGEQVEMYTYINKDGFKSISITNPSIKEERKTKEGKEYTANKNYSWVYDLKKDVPEVEVIKNKKGEWISTDDGDANQFFIDKIKEKFGNKETKSSELTEEQVADIF